MGEPLSSEWQAYRKACDRIDFFRYHPALGDKTADPRSRWRAAQQLCRVRETAIRASEQLIARAEQEAALDPEWLAELREQHNELVSDLRANQRILNEAHQQLRRYRAK